MRSEGDGAGGVSWWNPLQALLKALGEVFRSKIAVHEGLDGDRVLLLKERPQDVLRADVAVLEILGL